MLATGWGGLVAPCDAAEPIEYGETDWPWWRGPQRNGTAADQQLPLEWSDEENVLWKTPVPGRGHGSPTVVGDQVFLATADKKSQSVICYDRHTGKERWTTVVHSGGIWSKKSNEKASQASATVACDGKRLFITFLNQEAIYASALSREGKILWQTKICDYTLHQGYASSPAVYQSLVIVSADNKRGGAIAGLKRETGEIVWKHARPKLPNYASPSLLEVAGRTQLVLTGCKLVSSFDPVTGKKLWEIAGATEECVTTTVTDGKHVYSSGGWPRNHIAAILADGSGKVVWENTTRVYVPSMLIRDGYLYAVADAGIAICYDAATGKEMWKKRLGGTFSASPVLVGDKIFATNETGTIFIYRANPKKFESLGKTEMNAQVFATPTYCGGRIFMRTAKMSAAGRQEMLYCIGVAKQ